MKILYTPEILSCLYLSWFESESISCWGISELPRFWTRISVSFRFLFSTSSTLSSTPLPPPPPPTSSSSNTASQLGSDFRNLKNIIIYILGAQLNLILVKPLISKTSHFSIPNGLFLISKEFFLISIHFFSSSRQAILLFILLLTTVILPLNFLVVKPRALWTYIETSLAHCDLTLKYPRLSPIVRRWYVNPHPWPTVILPWNILIFRPLFLTLKYPVLNPLCS